MFSAIQKYLQLLCNVPLALDHEIHYGVVTTFCCKAVSNVHAELNNLLPLKVVSAQEWCN